MYVNVFKFSSKLEIFWVSFNHFLLIMMMQILHAFKLSRRRSYVIVMYISSYFFVCYKGCMKYIYLLFVLSNVLHILHIFMGAKLKMSWNWNIFHKSKKEIGTM